MFACKDINYDGGDPWFYRGNVDWVGSEMKDKISSFIVKNG